MGKTLMAVLLAHSLAGAEVGARWVEWTIDASGQIGQHVSLALDARGRPHLCYCRFVGPARRQLRYARWTGEEWAVQVVDASGDVCGMSSLALDGAGKAWISHYDYSSQSLSSRAGSAPAGRPRSSTGRRASGWTARSRWTAAASRT
ncbi:MAG: hypothetical protein HYZ28_06410 [Myxococcales bacterium]|nr:hypothetical protein [Myxococcales bacterium]